MQLTSTTIQFSSKWAHLVINNSTPCPYSKCSAVVVLTNEQPVQRLCPWVRVVWPPLTLVQIFFSPNISVAHTTSELAFSLVIGLKWKLYSGLLSPPSGKLETPTCLTLFIQSPTGPSVDGDNG